MSESSELRSLVPPLVLVTGASGFIGLHVVKQLVEKNYRVRGTVRSLSNAKKVEPIKALFPENYRFPLQLFEADLLQNEGWSEAVFDCDYVIHAAGHYPKDPLYDEAKLAKPTIEGTMRVLRACAREAMKKKLKRVVLTGSTLTIHGETDVDENRVYNESDWTDVTKKTCRPLVRCKTIAEKQAWDFVSSLPDECKFEFTVVNGAMCLGPILSDFTSTSHEILIWFMDRKKAPMLPHLRLCLCDVRDLAKALINAMTVPEAAGKRHVLVSANLWTKEFAEILQAEFGPYGYNFSQTYAPDSFLWVVRTFNKAMDPLIEILGKSYHFDSSKIVTSLGIEFQDAKTTIVDTVHSLIQRGHVKKTKEYKQPPEIFKSA